MLDSLARIFHAPSASDGPPAASASEADLLVSESQDNKRRAASIDLGTLAASTSHRDSHTYGQSSGPYLGNKPSTLSLATTPDRLRRPSQVSWRLPTPTATPTASQGSLLQNASPPLQGVDTGLGGNGGGRSTGRLGTPSPLVFDNDTESVFFPGSGSGSRPLSPIDETLRPPRAPSLQGEHTPGYGYGSSYFPRRKRESFDSERSLDVPPTPGSVRSFQSSVRAYDPHMIQLPGGAFITRPLKRTISQASTSSLRSTASAAPTIPPLDLRPAFIAPSSPPATSPTSAPVPRKSRFAPGTLPAVLGSPSNPRPKYSVIYEDGGSARTTASFHTAPGGSDGEESDGEDGTPKARAEKPPPGSATQSPKDGGAPYFVVQPPTPEDAAEQDQAARTRTPTLLAPPGMIPAGRTSSLSPLHEVDLSSPLRTRAGASPSPAPSRPSLTSSRTAEDAIFQRWLKGISFENIERPAFTGARTSAPCVLFWLGFFGPWCWLIGGWADSLARASRREPLLPLWASGGEKEAAKGKSKAAPLLAPSHESLAQSETLVNMTSTQRERAVVVDPWIWRCRVAAVVSGLLVFAAFIVAIVIVTVR